MELGQGLFSLVLRLMGALFAEEDSQLLEGGEDARGVVIACGITVFVIGTIPPVMALVLYGSMSPIG